MTSHKYWLNDWIYLKKSEQPEQMVNLYFKWKRTCPEFLKEFRIYSQTRNYIRSLRFISESLF